MGRFIFIILLIFQFSVNAYSQKCTFLFEIKLIDSITNESIPFAAVIHKESGQGSISEPDGTFHFHERCPGEQTFIISHIAYLNDTINILLSSDTFLLVELKAKVEWLEGVEIKDDYHAHDQRYIAATIENKTINAQSNKNLADILESIEGVNVLRTGAGISKPIIHGNYGNRVTTINRGITQSGQQWGNDHGLEVDAFGAERIQVIKGAGVLAYDGNSLGNVILIDSKLIAPDSNLHGEVNSIFQSNGLGITLNGSIEKSSKWASWRVTGTYKKMGDSKAPDYYLTNTGKNEQNISFQLNRNFFNKWYNELYASTYNTEIGILRGSHVSNITDLEEAMGREVPFYTNEHFSYEINPPRQQVNHNLIKYEMKYFTKPYSFFSFKYGWQWDRRNEYDVRRGSRSDIPALSLTMITHSLAASYNHHFNSGHTFIFGYQYNNIDNTNNPETGILPLLPDYFSVSNSVYAIIEKDRSKWGYDFGFRYNHKRFDVVTISRDLPRKIERFDNSYNNFALSGSLKYVWKTDWIAKLNANFAQRSPEVNELYSFGLHQGVASIEVGNPNLRSENSFKILASVGWKSIEKLHFQFIVYAQSFDNYIFLEPQDEFLLTIRGAYPLYEYSQVQALIYGSDFSLEYYVLPHFDIQFKYAIIRGENLSENISLINIPSDQIKLNLVYRISDGENWGESSVEIHSAYIFKQFRITDNQDFMPVPNAYLLLGLNASTVKYFSHTRLGFNLRIDNLLNNSYRDYLNRMRYFADDLGINVQVGVQFSF